MDPHGDFEKHKITGETSGVWFVFFTVPLRASCFGLRLNRSVVKSAFGLLSCGFGG